jgi:ABC-type nickel/cobalt efflux system permease component RcnA
VVAALAPVFLVAALHLADPQPAVAHPLGNFSINRHSQLLLHPGRAELIYTIDRAEIPAFQERTRIDANGDGQLEPDETQHYLAAQVAALQPQLTLHIDNVVTPLRYVGGEISFPEGQGGLSTQRIIARFEVALPAQAARIGYEDRAFAGRLGWQEIVVMPQAGVAVDADAPTQDLTNGLRDYPQDRLQTPLQRSRVSFVMQQMEGASAAGNSLRGTGVTAAGWIATVKNTYIDQALGRRELSVGAIAFALVVALAWGAAHALSPGHGKTLVAAYLIGQRATVGRALLLGLTTTVTHTAGVVALGAVSAAASELLPIEAVLPWIESLAGLMVIALGASLGWRRVRALRSARRDATLHASINPLALHDHGDGRMHSHLPLAQASARSLIALGVSGGLLPCPSALLLLLGAVAFNRAAFGLGLVLAFSAGLAGTLTAIGIGMVKARQWMERASHRGWLAAAARGPVLSLAPVLSAGVVALAGVAITWRALLQTGLFP